MLPAALGVEGAEKRARRLRGSVIAAASQEARMSYENIRFEAADGIGTLTVDRQPALNALNPPTLREMLRCLRDVRREGVLRALVLTGAGEKAFVAGADIKYMSELDVERAKEWGALGHEAGRLLETMPKPTIAAINGFALGGGCELALACDLRYASSNAKLGQPEVNLGIIPGWGGTQRLARVCGLGVAKELIFTGRTVAAEEALGIGLVNGVHDPVVDRAREVAQLLASKSPIALRVMKELANRSLGGSHPENLAAEADSFGEIFSSADATEGMTAFVEKRTPRFTGS
jgi:enoyl-CoA hydratase